MMQPAKTWEGDDISGFGRLDGSPCWRVIVKGHVRSVLVVEPRVLANAPPQVTFAENNQVIGQLPSQRSDQPLRVAVLPGRSRRDAQLLDAEVIHSVVERVTEDLVAIPDQKPERTVRAEGFDELLRGPCRVRMRGHMYVQEPPSLERQSKEHVQDIERHRRDREEVDCKCPGEMIANERPPHLRWPPRPVAGPRHVLDLRVLNQALVNYFEKSDAKAY
jgi:hypothetical protein